MGYCCSSYLGVFGSILDDFRETEDAYYYLVGGLSDYLSRGNDCYCWVSTFLTILGGF